MVTDPFSERRLLQNSVARLLKQSCGPDRVRASIRTGGFDPSLWREVGLLGIFGILLPESLGGMAGTMADGLAVEQEFGRRLAPVPFLHHVLAMEMIRRTAGEKAAKEHVLKGASGESIFSLPLNADTLEFSMAVSGAASGERRVVPFGSAAQWAPTARTGKRGKVEMWLVPLGTTGNRMKQIVWLDPTFPLSEWTVSAPKKEWVGPWVVSANVLEGVTHELSHYAAAWVCGEMLGGAEEVLSGVIEFVKTREQFGRPIGSFQAVQHKAAEMGILLEGIRSYVGSLETAFAGSTRGTCRHLRLAKAYVSDAYTRMTQTALQLYAGIGYTWEHDIHLYLRHAVRCGALFGSATALRAKTARAI